MDMLTHNLLMIAASKVATLVSISIGGLSTVNDSSTYQYTATGTFNDSSTRNLSSSQYTTWSVTSGADYGSISSSGLLTVYGVDATQTITIQASTTYGGVTVSNTLNVTVNKGADAFGPNVTLLIAGL
jgi:hypothetical protein